MITWSTYGTWLQGDDRRYVKNGRILAPNKSFVDSNKSTLVRNPVKLSKNQRQIIHIAIIAKAKKLKHNILALSVASTHIHLVLQYSPNPLGRIVSHYKNAALIALRTTGIKGRIWTAGYDKRYCFDKKSLNQRINYVLSHKRT